MTHRSYRLTHLLFILVLSGSFLAAMLSLLWASRHLSAPQSNTVLTQALPVLLTALLVLGTIATLLYHRLASQGRTSQRQTTELLDTQRRLQHQQEVWRHLRELHQQDIPEEHFLEAVQVSLRELLGVSRVSLWLFDHSRGVMTCRSSLDPALVGTSIDMDSIGAYIDTLHRAPCLESNHVQADERLVGLQAYLAEHQIVSMLDVGIFVGGELRGTLCCESQRPRQWQADEINSVMGVSGLLSQFAESLRRKAVEDDLYQHLHYDAVTGLPTLRGLDEAIEQTATQLRDFHLVVIRVRGLRHINEMQGQAGGDEAMRQVVAEIRRRLIPQRNAPRLARLPANKLVVILPGVHQDPWLQQRLSGMLVELTETPWSILDHSCQLRFSAGMAHFPRDGDHFDRVLQRAELALKHARRRAPPSLIGYSPQLSEQESRQMRIERELRTAIAEHQFRLFLQPQFRADGGLQGAELLLRWQHPRKGTIPPDAFIDHAERSGLIRPIGYWVLEQAVALLRGPLADCDLILAVNVSIQQLHDSDFIPHLETLLGHGGFAPDRLVLEIVESLLANPGMAATLEALHKLGVQLALDDFGTGYSSLRYLQDFPVDEIKLDKIFIDPLQQGRDAPLARSIIALAKTLHLRVVAEGIEVAEQLDFLRQQRVDLLQGYFLAPPEPAEAFLARLESHG